MACAWAQVTIPAIAAKYVDRGVTAIVNQFRYMCCLKQFQKELNEEESVLDALQQDVKQKLEQERKNTNIPNKVVQKWIDGAKEAMNDAVVLQNALKEDQHCFNNLCPNWLWRYRKSKEAKGLITNIKNLKDDHNRLPQDLAHKADIPNIAFLQSDGFIPSKASKHALRKIMSALDIDGVNAIGLHGMPGVGKTTLAKQVVKEAMKKMSFCEFLIVTISERPDMIRFAEQLKLELASTSSLEDNARKLMLRLLDENKKLLVLDDVWGELDLSTIGIPPIQDLKNCQILMTTRRIPSCEAMKCQRMILLDTLTEDEAWTLFKKATDISDSSLKNYAKLVAKECGGLPLAIMSVGKALRGKAGISSWKHALKKLQKGEIEDIRDMSKNENAYRSLKFSFDQLPREKTKRCLLLCAFFPEDYAIFVPQLASYAVRLGVYPQYSLSTSEEIIEEFSEEFEELKNSHLLLESEVLEGAFTLHDLVRDVVLKIGSRYSDPRYPTTEEFAMEMVRHQISYQHFQDEDVINSSNESPMVDIQIADFIDSQELVLYKSAESACYKIIQALQTDGVNVIGLHGLKRVGKTSWAKQIAYGAVKMKLFDECVFICVPLKLDIEKQIARGLKLKLNEESTPQQRAEQVTKRLMDDKKKILVLDSINRTLDLKAIGIPSTENLKILITTSKNSLCKEMKCQRNILLGPLTKEEERSLIDTIKNSAVEEPSKFAAYKIIEEFKRSPAALKLGRLVDCRNPLESTNLLRSIFSCNPGTMLNAYLTFGMSFQWRKSNACYCAHCTQLKMKKYQWKKWVDMPIYWGYSGQDFQLDIRSRKW